MTALNPIAITFCGYLLLMVIIGFIAWHYTRDFNDYVLGGRRSGGARHGFIGRRKRHERLAFDGAARCGLFVGYFGKLVGDRTLHRLLCELENRCGKASCLYRTLQKRFDAAGLFKSSF